MSKRINPVHAEHFASGRSLDRERVVLLLELASEPRRLSLLLLRRGNIKRKGEDTYECGRDIRNHRQVHRFFSCQADSGPMNVGSDGSSSSEMYSSECPF